MTYTKRHATENAALRERAVTALRAVGWCPEPEPRNWTDLAVNATYLVLRELPAEVTFRRARHQVISVMMAYRRKPGEWTK